MLEGAEGGEREKRWRGGERERIRCRQEREVGKREKRGRREGGEREARWEKGV